MMIPQKKNIFLENIKNTLSFYPMTETMYKLLQRC